MNDCAGACNAGSLFFANLNRLFNLFSSSPKRWELIRQHGFSLHSQSTTRWSARLEAVKPLFKHYNEILDALDRLVETQLSPDDEACGVAESLAQYFCSFEAVVLTATWYHLLRKANAASVKLQDKKMALSGEVEIIQELINDVSSCKESWKDVRHGCSEMAEALDLSVDFTSYFNRYHRRLRRALPASDEEKERHFITNVYEPMHDACLSSLRERFEDTRKLVNTFACLWEYPGMSDDQIKL
ncbi:hypothetical protein FOZ63_031423 [Perkinsus olseni]|uniref:Uncharacterized protein n=1 Tax=Perkinsus olseni TaxID=32597 RepID=A0A7J6S3Z4_PEROL|nr:hypothetical protein FOZ63_031423 [Perkinsus olseni]